MMPKNNIDGIYYCLWPISSFCGNRLPYDDDNYLRNSEPIIEVDIIKHKMWNGDM